MIDQLRELFDRHGWPVVIFFVSLLGIRVVWRDIIIPLRDRVFLVLERLAELLSYLIVSQKATDKEQEMQGTTLARVYEKLEEVQETCDLTLAQVTGVPKPQRPTRRVTTSGQVVPTDPSSSP